MKECKSSMDLLFITVQVKTDGVPIWFGLFKFQLSVFFNSLNLI